MSQEERPIKPVEQEPDYLANCFYRAMTAENVSLDQLAGKFAHAVRLADLISTNEARQFLIGVVTLAETGQLSKKV